MTPFNTDHALFENFREEIVPQPKVRCTCDSHTPTKSLERKYFEEQVILNYADNWAKLFIIDWRRPQQERLKNHNFSQSKLCVKEPLRS